ncbi:thiamine diphosphokinase [Shimia marina]|nr:thiamine diphosphokinase [Shimia marina]
MTAIVHCLEPITVVGAGPLNREAFDMATALAPRIVAADGGAQHCLDMGHAPERVIGDMDSLPVSLRAQLTPDQLCPVAEQETTDFDKVLRYVQAPLVLGVGFSGGRLDHELACFSTLLRHPGQRVILIGAEDIVCLAPPRLQLDLTKGTRVSLFPMVPVVGQSSGLQWPIDDIAFAPDGMIGTSNAALGPVTLRFEAPGMLLILPRAWLAALVRQLLETPEGWPAL